MIHKVKYGYMEVVLESSLTTERAPDLMFKGAEGKAFVVFFAPFDSAEAEAMVPSYYDYCAPFEAEYSDEEMEAARNAEQL